MSDLEKKANTARSAADAAEAARVAANDEARKLAHEAAALEEKLRFANWKKIQEDAGFTVEGDTMATARVVELAEGPTHDVEVP